MSKNDAKETKTDLAKAVSTVPTLATDAQKLAKLQSAEQLRALEDAMGIDVADVEVIAAGSLPFWPAYAGAMLIGTIQNRRDVKTQWKTPNNPDGLVGVYTVRIENRPCLAGTLDGEIFELNPGELITLLERSVMKELRTRVGQKIGVLCLGKKEGRIFNYWDYKIIGQQRNAAQIQAAAQLAMAGLQAKQLESHNEE